jgi:protein-tyrosine phosphatase
MAESLVHFIGSDGHDCKHRPPTLDQAFQYVSKRFGEKSAVTLFSTNPLAVLNGEPIPAEASVELVPSRKWFLPWR